jgi:hypothetical protein
MLRRFAIVLLGAWGACAYPDAQIHVEAPPGFERERQTISVFGVFRDGRVRPEAWDELAPQLGLSACTAVFGERLRAEDPELFARSDETTKEEGISSAVMAGVAPRAEGRLIVALSIGGQLRTEKRATSAASSINSRSSRGGRLGPHVRHDPADDSALELGASLYSVEQHAIVARIDVRYTGASEDDALKILREKMQALLPSATCAGWRWQPRQ